MRVYFTIGIPCSGKSAWAEKLIMERENTINFSRIDIRNTMLKKKRKNFFDLPKEFRNEINGVVDELSKHLSQVCKLDVIFDSTNLIWKSLASNVAHYYDSGWDVTFVIFPVENVVVNYPIQQFMLKQYRDMFSKENRERFENFVDAYGIEVIYITNEEQYELLYNDVEGGG